MYLGTSLGLIAVGLILALAINFELSGIDIKVIGWILVAVGIVGVIADLAILRNRRTTVGTREVVRERDVI